MAYQAGLDLWPFCRPFEASSLCVILTFTYDTMGRMLMRNPYPGGDRTSFVWDGWDCVREFNSGSTTRYYCLKAGFKAMS